MAAAFRSVVGAWWMRLWSAPVPPASGTATLYTVLTGASTTYAIAAGTATTYALATGTVALETEG